MPSQTDNDYLLERAEAELDLAQGATHERAVRAHYLLAGLYLDRVYGGSDVGSEEKMTNAHPIRLSATPDAAKS